MLIQFHGQAIDKKPSTAFRLQLATLRHTSNFDEHVASISRKLILSENQKNSKFIYLDPKFKRKTRKNWKIVFLRKITLNKNLFSYDSGHCKYLCYKAGWATKLAYEIEMGHSPYFCLSWSIMLAQPIYAVVNIYSYNYKSTTHINTANLTFSRAINYIIIFSHSNWSSDNNIWIY